MEPFTIKTLCAVLLWTISVAFGVLLPYFLWTISPKHPRLISSGTDDSTEDEELEELISPQQPNNGQSCCSPWTRSFTSHLRVKLADGNFSSAIYCLCGGVFLGVSLLDLIPQSRTAVEAMLEQARIPTGYPVAEFMIAFGLLLVMAIENIVFESMLASNSCMRSASTENYAGETAARSSEAHQNVARYRMYILVATLSLHSIFEGLAIGLQEELSTLVQLVIAVSVHKAVLSFGIGLPLMETLGYFGKVSVAVLCTMIFCTASPVGCLIGAFISGNGESTSAASIIASAVLQCLATGTFLYVTFVEVLPREFSHHGRGPKHKGENSWHSVSHNEHTNAQRHADNCSVVKRYKRQSQLVKLLALITGFSVAAGLQFL